MAESIFGSLGLQGFFKAKEENQQRSQFAQKLAVEQRQNSLLNDIRRSNLYIEQQRLAMDQANAGKPKLYDEYYVTYDEKGTPIAKQYPGLPQKLSTQKPYLLRSDVQNGQAVDVYGTKDAQGNEIITNIDRQNLPSNKNEGLTAYQQAQAEEKRVKRIEDNSLKADLLIKAHQGGKIERNDNGSKRFVYEVGNNIFNAGEWKPRATQAVNSLLKDYNLNRAKNKLWSGTRNALRKQGVNFDQLKPNEKRNYLKQVLDNTKDIPAEEKKVLYQTIEVYTR